jgi:hypothetical protein
MKQRKGIRNGRNGRPSTRQVHEGPNGSSPAVQTHAEAAAAAVDAAPEAARADVAAAALQAVPDAAKAHVAAAAVGALSAPAKAEVTAAMANELPAGKQEELVERLGGPDQVVTNAIWRWVVMTFAVVLLAATVALVGALFISFWRKVDTTLVQMLLTVFTTVAGILAGFVSGRASTARPRSA